MKMLQSSFTRVLTASARSCWSGKFAQSDAGQPPTFPPAEPPSHPLDFPLIFLVTYNNYMPVSTHTWPFKWATPRMLATPCWFSSLSLGRNTHFYGSDIKAKKRRMSFVCSVYFSFAQLTRFPFFCISPVRQ